MDYTVTNIWTDDFMGVITVRGDEITVDQDIYGGLDALAKDAKEYGAEVAMSKWDNVIFEPLSDVNKGIEAHGEISKIDEDRQLVFGWAYVTHDKDGQVSVDKSGEFVDDYEEIEKAAYDFVVKSRAGDADHTNIKGSEMVESMVFTPEKIEKMGIPQGTIPTGWWVGFKVEDADLWKSVKEGKRLAFSVHGKGTRKEVDDG